MDEVNHVKMVVSLCYFVVLDYFPCLLDGYECGINVLIGERLLKFYFADFLNVLNLSGISGYFTVMKVITFFFI